MEKKNIGKYAPYAIVIITLILQWNMFVTPAVLEKTHREIIQHVAEKYASKEDVTDMRKKLDKIYDIIVMREGERNKK